MGSLLSKKEVKYQRLPSEHELSTISITLSRYLSAIVKQPPLKLKLVYLYFSIYNKIFGPWGRIVGSYSDCLCISSSDIDIMLDRCIVYSSIDEIPPSKNIALIIYTDDTDIPPGCCLLRVYERDASGKFVPVQRDSVKFEYTFRSRRREVYIKLVNVNGFNCLSSRDILEQRHQHGLTMFETLNKCLPNWRPHGPAFRQTYFGIFDVDIVEAFTCTDIPETLLKWTRRNRKHWSSPETIKKALQQGCHVIGLPSKITPKENIESEWRLGYGNMEKILTESLNDCQKQCYVLLKIMLKEHIEPSLTQDDILSSYTMKTLIFWMAEEVDPDIWKPENLLNCFQKCLQKLGSWIDSEYCPNYFIPEYNIFRTKLQQMRELDLPVWFRNHVANQGWGLLCRCTSTQFVVE